MAADDDPRVLKIRHANFVALLNQSPNPIAFAVSIGVTPNYVNMLVRQSIVRDRPRHVTEAIARRVEARFGLVAGWLDAPEHQAAAKSILSPSSRAVERALREHWATWDTMDPALQAECREKMTRALQAALPQ